MLQGFQRVMSWVPHDASLSDGCTPESVYHRPIYFPSFLQERKFLGEWGDVWLWFEALFAACNDRGKITTIF